MPLYEYRCDGCGRRFEALMARIGDPVPACPGCGAAGARRVPSTFAVARPAPPPGPCGAADCACRPHD